MQVVVTGGRGFTDRRRIFEALDVIHANRHITRLSHGDCRGADRLAAEWAAARGIPARPFPADWDNIDAAGARIRFRNGRPYNAVAGPQRNLRMLEAADPELVIAFPGGTGTAHCVAAALRLGIAVMSVEA